MISMEPLDAKMESAIARRVRELAAKPGCIVGAAGRDMATRAMRGLPRDVGADAATPDPAADIARLRAALAAERERVRVLREACVAWQDWCRLDQQSRTHPDAPVLQEKRVTAFRTAEQLTAIALAATEPTP